MGDDGKMVRTSFYPFPLTEEQYKRMHRPSYFDSSGYQFASQSKEERTVQSIMRAECNMSRLYEEIASWFAGRTLDFGISHCETNGKNYFWWAGQGGHKRDARRWLGRKERGIGEIALAVSCGGYDVDDVGRLLAEQGYHGKASADAISDIYDIYDSACFEHTETLPPVPPMFGNWKRNLEWFCECRDMVGAAPMLEAWASGVPIDDIILESAASKRKAAEMRSIRSGRFDDVLGEPDRFPNARGKR